MVSISSLKNKKILVFGIGISGQATIRKLQKKVKDLSVWDDNVVHRNELKKITNINLNSKYFKDSFDLNEFNRLIKEESNDLDRWELSSVVGHKKNRLLSYPCDYFHSKYPKEFEESRVVFVMFYKTSSYEQ